MYTDREFYKVVEEGERCRCGGEIDKRTLIQSNPDIYDGRCFVCGERCTVVWRIGNSSEVNYGII